MRTTSAAVQVGAGSAAIVFFCRVRLGLLVAASLAMARMPGCWATGSSWATSGGMWLPARYGSRNM